MTTHDDSCQFLTTQDDLWQFTWFHEGSWQFVAIYSKCDDSWQVIKSWDDVQQMTLFTLGDLSWSGLNWTNFADFEDMGQTGEFRTDRDVYI